MSHRTFILGGARSGKSRFALELGNRQPGAKIYLATAEARDDEMAARIAAHQRERGGDWRTFEEARHVAETLQSLPEKDGVVILDCLTLWLCNVLLAAEGDEKKTRDRIGQLISVSEKLNVDLIAVSNEVGQGIVPADARSRGFRDLAGAMNQGFAAASDAVYWMTAGIPQKIK